MHYSDPLLNFYLYTAKATALGQAQVTFAAAMGPL